MNSFLMISIMITVLIAAAVIGLMLLMLRRVIIRPIQNLTDISTDIANGRISVQLSGALLRRNDEMGMLGRSYEVMRKTLEKLVSDNEALFGNIITGKLGTRGESAEFSGLYARLIDNMNDTLDVIGMYFDSIPACFAILNTRYHIVFTNRHFTSIFGSYTNEAFLELMLGEDGEHNDPKSRLTECISKSETEWLRRFPVNGEEHCYSFILSEVTYGTNKRGAIVVVMDNTELVRAKDEAQSASKAKSEFLSRVSHELRTPLNAILSMAKLGLDDVNISRSNRRFQQIVTSSAHLSSIINDVLEMSRMESGKTEIRLAPIDITALISECVSMLALRVKENDNALIPRVDTSIPPRVIGDEFRIKQVLLNLLSNSGKFTEKGIIRLEADCLEKNEQSCLIQFTVSDTGIGMSEEFLQKLFMPFEQEDSFLSRRYEGSGLGLSISHNLVGLMGGEMIVTSELGKGSCFKFAIRFDITSEGISGDNGEQETQADDFSLEGIRILLVDDIEINRQIVIEVLEGSGLTIDEAADGEEAVRKYMASQVDYYDCVLMDVQMPKMDGYQATQLIRSSNRPDQTIPVIAMTANALKEDVENALRNGMNDHLAKPIDFALLVSTVKKHCARRHR